MYVHISYTQYVYLPLNAAQPSTFHGNQQSNLIVYSLSIVKVVAS